MFMVFHKFRLDFAYYWPINRRMKQGLAPVPDRGNVSRGFALHHKDAE